MDKQKFMENLTNIVKEYIADEEAYCDNAQLQVTISSWELEIADPDSDMPGCDYWPMMDIIRMSTVEPGKWEPDYDALSEIAEEYDTLD